METNYDNLAASISAQEWPNNTCPGPLSLPVEDRPRERLIRSGPEFLSDRELLSIILVSGIHGKNVTVLALEILENLDREKYVPPVKELCRVTGMGESKACTIVAMLEFGRRRWAGGQAVQCPGDIFQAVRHYADRQQEIFLVISLNGAHEILATRVTTIGLANRTIVHPREVFSEPILDRASAIAVAHNHPSGNLKPSGEDCKITERLKIAADVLGLTFLDHLIFTDSSFLSFREEGLIQDTQAEKAGALPNGFSSRGVETFSANY